ncbi:MAG: hypothetical protein ACRC1G_19875 [Bradyrhizobium sp.]|nr:hypothetical protein [Bradyrhizobium sp.]
MPHPKNPDPRHGRDADMPKPGNTGSQGIVRDERGQEQPADKERAQRKSESDTPDRH